MKTRAVMYLYALAVRAHHVTGRILDLVEEKAIRLVAAEEARELEAVEELAEEMVH